MQMKELEFEFTIAQALSTSADGEPWPGLHGFLRDERGMEREAQAHTQVGRGGWKGHPRGHLQQPRAGVLVSPTSLCQSFWSLKVDGSGPPVGSHWSELAG